LLQPAPDIPEQGNKGIDVSASSLVKHMIFGKDAPFVVPMIDKVGFRNETASRYRFQGKMRDW
jgi:hypothetical protein